MNKGITYVSFFIRIYENSLYGQRDNAYYFSKFVELAKTGINMCVYIDDSMIPFFKEITFPNVKIIKIVEIKELWAYNEIQRNIEEGLKNEQELTLPNCRTHEKDTIEYMVLMLSKIDFVKDAIEKNPFDSSHFAWIDFSISYIFKNLDSCQKLLQYYNYIQLDDNFLCIPGCTDKISISDTDSFVNRVNWRFCGGFFIGDKNSLEEFYNLYRFYFPQFLAKYKKITWEVNFWAWLEGAEPKWNPIWCKADHNDSIIEIPFYYHSISLKNICKLNFDAHNVDTVIDPVIDPIVDTIVDPVIDPIFDPVVDPVVDPAVDPIVDPIIDPIFDPVVDPIFDPIFDPVVDPPCNNHEDILTDDSNYDKIKYDYPHIDGFSPSSASHLLLKVVDKDGNDTNKVKHVVNTRYISYKINEEATYHYFNSERNIISRNICSFLDENTFLPISFIEVTEESIGINKKENSQIQGMEDIRLFSSSGCKFIEGQPNELEFIASSVNYSNHSHNRMILGKYVINESENKVNLTNCRVIDSPTPGDQTYVCEKNWIPVIGDSKCIYKWSPFEIINIDADKNQPTPILSIPVNSPICKRFRGSTIFIPSDHPNSLIGVVHFTEWNLKKLCYYHCLVIIDRDTLIPKKYSHPFYFENRTIEYCIGFYIENNNHYFWISQMDSDPLLIVVPSSKFANLFIDYS